MQRIALKSLVLALLAALPAHALLTRADRADDEYVELATRYGSAVSLGAGQGEGVLVAPAWILTTARRAAVLRDLQPRPEIAIENARYAIETVIVHPEWKGGRENDLALVKLAKPVQGLAPVLMNREPDEAAQAIVIVAHGMGGRLGANPEPPRRKRAAINTVGELQPRTFIVTIKRGDDASDLQGAALREETGAPAYLDGPDGFTLAGILQSIDEVRPDAASGTAGERESFIRVSAYAAWIESVIR